MRNLDFSHLSSNAVGFERMARELEGLFDQKAAAYPPYNIEKREHDGYRITVAIEGIKQTFLHDNDLVVAGHGGKRIDVRGS